MINRFEWLGAPVFKSHLQIFEKRLFSFVLSVRPSVRPSFNTSVYPPAWNNSGSTGGIFIKFYVWVFFENLCRIFRSHYNRTRITGTLHEDRYTFFVISPRILLRIKVPEKIIEKVETYILFAITFFYENRAVYEIMWKKYILEPDRPRMVIWRMRIARWISKATDTHTQRKLLLIATAR